MSVLNKTCLGFKPIWYIFRGLKFKGPRVRFAPSPTGYLHLGGLRTALYNYLFAKSNGGKFILRIEDTDQSRKVDGSIEALIRDLEWVGLKYDEGPGQEGDFGPYKQSERLNIYQDKIKKLLDNGSAYYCFCTERRLNILRRNAIRAQLMPKYDNRCRHLSKQEVHEKIAAGVPHCVRFKLTSDIQHFEDLIFGGIAYDVSLNEGDPVLMKSDGYPTYHLANVIDDHLMAITHVLRGVEWQISTTKHLLLYRAFNWEPPQFGHLPLIVNADGTKLSKRQNDVHVEDYKKQGIFPLALVNYITLAGGGFDHVPGAGIGLKTLSELAEEIDRISSHSTRLNPDLLEECNRLEIKRQLSERNTTQHLIRQIQELVTSKYSNLKLNTSEENIKTVLSWATSRITRIEDLVSPKLAFLWVLPSNPNVEENNKVILLKLVNELEDVKTFEEVTLKKYLKDFCDRNKTKFPELMKTLRLVLSGLNEGPGVAEMLQLLGKEQALYRIKTVLH
ncbi:Probable glutamate--tRNA ligase, mitochondrial [Eumeta japonica]|uniref:Nondiscriminating glutamyl-tRNA synthetase EARS2, mitochondrial n=1 Tax=Eumeta variegata TaxID=151549 RepID=A0A4C1THM1_EUMVA|nr:Probable glutamate--tRNA ligase, mitochondrial [Eumeta japonica]